MKHISTPHPITTSHHRHWPIANRRKMQKSSSSSNSNSDLVVPICALKPLDSVIWQAFVKYQDDPVKQMKSPIVHYYVGHYARNSVFFSSHSLSLYYSGILVPKNAVEVSWIAFYGNFVMFLQSIFSCKNTGKNFTRKKWKNKFTTKIYTIRPIFAKKTCKIFFFAKKTGR